jgi:hypothetical protein
VLGRDLASVGGIGGLEDMGGMGCML